MMVFIKEGTQPIKEDHKFSRDREFLPNRHDPISHQSNPCSPYSLKMKSKRLKNMRGKKILHVVVPSRKPCCSSTRMWLRGLPIPEAWWRGNVGEDCGGTVVKNIVRITRLQYGHNSSYFQTRLRKSHCGKFNYKLTEEIWCIGSAELDRLFFSSPFRFRPSALLFMPYSTYMNRPIVNQILKRIQVIMSSFIIK